MFLKFYLYFGRFLIFSEVNCCVLDIVNFFIVVVCLVVIVNKKSLIIYLIYLVYVLFYSCSFIVKVFW